MTSSSKGIRLTSLSKALQTRILAELPRRKRGVIAADSVEVKVAKMRQLIADLESKVYDVKKAREEARKITSEIKRSVVDEISSRVEELAKKVGVDADDLADAQRDILEANDALQSSIFSLDELFDAAKSSLEDRITDLEWEIDELRGQEDSE